MLIVDHIENWFLPNMLSTLNKVVIIIIIIIIIIKPSTIDTQPSRRASKLVKI